LPASGSSAKRYAQAVFEIAKERDRLEQWLEELQAIAEALEQPDFAALLKNPRLPIDAKRQVISETFAGASKEAINLATILILSGRLEALARPIAQEYERRLDEERGIVRVEVTTAVELTKAQSDQVSQQLATETGKHIRMEHRVDPSAIGGMVIKIGDQVIDGSVRSKLRGLKRNLAEVLA